MSDIPADLLSRGENAEGLMHDCRWFNGPEFLRKGDAVWPVTPCSLEAISSNDPEIRKEAHVHLTSILPPLDSMFQRYSSWYKLKRGVTFSLQTILVTFTPFETLIMLPL